MAYTGSNLRYWRRKAGLSQTALAQRIGTSANMIGCYERNDTHPSITRAEEIAGVLGISLCQLMYGEGNVRCFIACRTPDS